MSLPRDTLTHTSSGSDAKLNSAYGRNDGGQEGMEALLDYVSDIIGYRPDGYMLITLDALRGCGEPDGRGGVRRPHGYVL